MAKRKNRPQPGQQPQQQVNVDLSKATNDETESFNFRLGTSF